MSAYDKTYLYDAMDALAEAFDYAARDDRVGAQRFFDLFVQTDIAAAFGGGSPRYVAGMSGIELVLQVCERAGMRLDPLCEALHAPLDRSPEYWCGWILAYAQWRSGRPFASLHEKVSMKDLMRLYEPLHEASEDRAADAIESLIDRKAQPTRLKTIRQARGMTQKQLARASGASLRAVQQYEQRAKDINGAHAMKLYALARTLGCTMEDLLEF